MTKLFFDIETIPCEERDKNKFLEILKKKHGNDLKEDDDLFRAMSFDGSFGRICCIGVMKENFSGDVILQKVLVGDEKAMLQEFWEIASDVQQFIGHNIWAFDLPFIYKRSVIHGVRTRPLSFARYRNIPIYDTMMEWDLWNMERGRAQKLDTLAKVLHLPTSKDTMDGSMVWQYFQDGKLQDIATYCMKDVELTRKVYKKMNFITDRDMKAEETFYD